jgi:hypothetical protein
MTNIITTYKFADIEAEDYKRDGPLSVKQKLRQLSAMGYDVPNPDIIREVTEILKNTKVPVTNRYQIDYKGKVTQLTDNLGKLL